MPDPTNVEAPLGRLIDRLIPLALTALICVAVVYALMRRQVAHLEAEITARPPVIVVDFARMATALKGRSADVIEGEMARVRGRMMELGDAGYVVLDGQAVLSAPDDLFLTPLDAGAPRSGDGR